MKDDAPETILHEVAAIFEEHNKILQEHRQAFEQLFAETGQIKQRLDKLESADSLDSSDTEFLKDVVIRLQAVLKDIPATFQKKS